MHTPAVKLGLFLVMAAVLPVPASPPMPSSDAVMAWIRSQAQAGDVADFAEKPAEWRFLDGRQLSELLTAQNGVHPYGVHIKNAVITNKLNLSNVSVPHQTRFENCRFNEQVDFSGSRFARSLQLNGCQFLSRVNGRHMQVDLSLDFSSSYLFGTNQLSEGVLPPPGFPAATNVPPDLRGAFQFHGVELTLPATVQPSQQQSNSWVVTDRVPTSYSILKHADDWFEVYRQTRFGGVLDLGGATVGKNFTAWDTQFSGEAKWDALSVGSTVFLDGSVFGGRTSLGYAKVTDEFSANNTHFTNSGRELNFYGAKIGGSVLFRNARFDAPVNFILLNVGANFDASGAVFAHGANMREDESASFHYNADFGSMNVQGYALFVDAKFNGWTSFKDAACQRLYLDRVAWPAQESPGRNKTNMLRLDGLRYHYIRAITGPAKGLTDAHHRLNHKQTWENLKNVLVHSTPFSSDVYINLENFFQREGELDLADQVYIERKRQERQQILWPSRWQAFPMGWASWFGSAALDALVRYGRQPEMAFAWCTVFVLFGCWVFRFENMKRKPRRKDEIEEPSSTEIWARGKGTVCQTEPNGSSGEYWWDWLNRVLRSQSPNYLPIWYSLGQFVPLIDLKANDDWRPDPLKRFACHYLVVHKIVGAILIPIGLAALTGIVK